MTRSRGRGANMAWGLFPVYCETEKEYCQDDDVFLGMHPLNVAIRCPICGRFTRCRKGVNDGKAKGKELHGHSLR